MTHLFKNRFGRLIVRQIEEFREVNTIRSSNYSPDIYFNYDIEEKIVAITQMKNCQMCTVWDSINNRPIPKLYLAIHKSTSVAAACEILELKLDPRENTEEEIKELSFSKIFNKLIVINRGNKT